MNSKTTAESRGGDHKYKRHVEGSGIAGPFCHFSLGVLPERCLEAVELGVEYRMVSMVMHAGM